jgi:dolichol-phosphate mannosyltransferase
MSKPDLAIVIPAWNESENLESLLPSLRKVIGNLGLVTEILVVDGGSQDGSREITERFGARFVLQEQRGYGGALLAGFGASSAPHIVTMDADLSHQPVFLADLWKHRDKAEVVIASRYVVGGRAEMTVSRLILSRVLNRTFGWILSLPVKDLSSGFRLYRREAIANLELRARDFDILEEILVRIYLQGWRVREVPFSYMPRGSGSSHARLVKFGIAFLRTLTRMYRLRHSGNQTRLIEFDASEIAASDPLPAAQEGERAMAKMAGHIVD